jgi:iron complex transport system substrate-binding protein
MNQTIDNRVPALVHDGLSVFHLAIETLHTLRPDLIVTQEQCHACALSASELLEMTRHLLGASIDVISLQPLCLQDIWDDIHRLGGITGRQKQAADLLTDLFARVQTIIAETIRIPEPPRVAVIERIEPLLLAGKWVPELIQLAGGYDGLCTAALPPRPVDWNALCDYAPQVLIVAPYGITLDHTRADSALLQRLPGWHNLPAVRQGAVYAIDEATSLHRPGPRIVESLKMLAGLTHPDLFGDALPEAGRGYSRLTELPAEL